MFDDSCACINDVRERMASKDTTGWSGVAIREGVFFTVRRKGGLNETRTSDRKSCR